MATHNFKIELLNPSTGNGTNTSFTTTSIPSNGVYFIVDGLKYHPSDLTYPFSYSGTNVTAGFVPSNGQVLGIIYEYD